MVWVIAAVLPEGSEKKLDLTRLDALFEDHVMLELGQTVFLGVSGEEVTFHDLDHLRFSFSGSGEAQFLAFVAKEGVNFTEIAYKLYGDPFTNPSLYKDKRLVDGSIFIADETYDIPEDSFRFLNRVYNGVSLKEVYRKGGIQTAAISKGILTVRVGDYHTPAGDAMNPFSAKKKGKKKVEVVSFSIKGSKISVDSTFKPKHTWY